MTEERKQQLCQISDGNEFRKDEYMKLSMTEAYFIYNQYKEATDDVGKVKAQFFYQLTIDKLNESDALYVLFLKHFNIAYAVCDPETFDDEISVYLSEEEAEEAAKEAEKEGHLQRVVTYQHDNLIRLYQLLICQGVNVIRVHVKGEDDIVLMVDHICKAPNEEDFENKALALRNPALSLTMTYFMEEVQYPEEKRDTDKMGELQEEMIANVIRGKFLVPLIANDQGGNEIAFLTDAQQKVFLPIFTDVGEIYKANLDQEVQTAIVEIHDLRGILNNPMEGVAINPYGANMRMDRKALISLLDGEEGK